MPEIANITNIVAPRVPFTDPRTGLISREWYRFLLNLFTITGSGASIASLEDLQTGPDDTSLTIAQIDEINKSLTALNIQPPVVIPASNARYGSFYSTLTQTAAVINTAYPITFNSTALSNGVYIGTPTSRVYVDRPGKYNIQFSLQLDNTVNAVGNFYLWLRINGVDVPYSAGWVAIRDRTAQTVAAWNFVDELNAGDYFELVWSTNSTSVQILSTAIAAPVPAIPSVILTVTDNIST